MKRPKLRILGKELQRFSIYDLALIARENLKVFGIEENPEDVYVISDYDYEYGSNDRSEYVVVRENKLESDEAYQKRLALEEESKKKSENKKRDKEVAERRLLAELKKKYEKS